MLSFYVMCYHYSPLIFLIPIGFVFSFGLDESLKGATAILNCCQFNCPPNYVGMVSFIASSPKIASMLMQLLINQLEPLTEQQLMGICNLQQLSQQAEDALSQGMDALQQSLAETLASGTPATSGSSGNVANYMGQMAMAMGKLGTLEGFLRQVCHSIELESLLSKNL